MSNLKETRERIESINSIIKITSAMKMVSASKLRKFKEVINNHNPFYNKITYLFDFFYNDFKKNSFIKKKYIKYRESNNDKILFIVISSNKGLCGSFNSYIFNKFNFITKNLYKKNIFIITIGKKCKNLLYKKYNIFNDKSNILDNINFNKISCFTNDIISKYILGDFNKIKIIYSFFKNKDQPQKVISKSFLPIILLSNKKIENKLEYIFESSKNNIYENIILNKLKIELYNAILESCISENLSRMMSMHKANDNASKLKKELIINYNKLRQSIITNEIIEIISGSNT